jgi:four helix bundle protein
VEKDDKFGFENLDVWQRSIDERFGIVSQMRRAAVSVSSNIAEGSSRWSRNEQARFFEIAYGSLMELISEAKIAEHQNFISAPNTQL